MDGMEESLIFAIGNQKLCRLCLQSKGAMTNIFENQILNNQITQIVGIQCDQNYDLPMIICHKCRYIIEAAYELQLVAAESHKTLMMAALKACRLDPLKFDEKYEMETRVASISPNDIKTEIGDIDDGDLGDADATSFMVDTSETGNIGDVDIELPIHERLDFGMNKPTTCKRSRQLYIQTDKDLNNCMAPAPFTQRPVRGGGKRKRSLSPNEKCKVFNDELIYGESDDDAQQEVDYSFEDNKCILESDHNTDSEQSGNGTDLETGDVTAPLSPVGEVSEEVLIDEGTGSQSYYYGKDKFKWAAEPHYTAGTLNVFETIPPSSGTTYCTSFQDLWQLIFTDDMIDLIVQCTNKKLLPQKTKYKVQAKPELNPTNAVEIKALIGLILYTSVFRCNKDSADQVYATDGSGREIFRCVMSKARFQILLQCLRFDDLESRTTGQSDDKIAGISDIFNRFIENCQSNYTLGSYVCVDEMLVAFRGKCPFIVYMPSKPAKYGLKLVLLVDAKTFYVYNAYIYCGKGSDGDGLTDSEKRLTVPTQSVIRLCKVIENSHRNVTADNWFSSLELVQSLKERGLTYLGSLKKSTKQIPPEFLASAARTVGGYLYGFTKDYTIFSHVPKPMKSVILISSMHHGKKIDQKNKPVILTDYNLTKGGVDELNKKFTKYSCSRKTGKWPLAIFCRLLDISGVNAFILYEGCVDVKKMSRGSFLLSLARELVVSQVKLRVYNERLPKELRETIQRVLGPKDMPIPPTKAITTTESDPLMLKRKTCVVCPSRLKRKTKFACCVCNKPICLGCSNTVCAVCKDLIC